MKTIPLTKGKFAIVDDNDHECLMTHKWYAVADKGTFYAVRHGKNKKMIRMHRLLMGAEDSQQIDHINRNSLDNRRSNLRFCTHSQNLYNRSSAVGKTSKYKGVHWDKDRCKWHAIIAKEKAVCNLGRFDSEIEAAKAYDDKAKILHGEFACLNFHVY